MPTLKGVRVARNGKDRLSVLKTLWKILFAMVSFLITGKSYEINLCFLQRPSQSAVYNFKKNRKQKKADLETKKRLMVRFTLPFTPFILYVYGKR